MAYFMYCQRGVDGEHYRMTYHRGRQAITIFVAGNVWECGSQSTVSSDIVSVEV